MTERDARAPLRTFPARMQPLARLPLFIDLTGRRVVVAGASEAVAWKAELFSAAGGDVEVFAETPDAELLAIIERGTPPGRLTLSRRAWTAADLDGAALAVLDADDAAEIDAFRAAGHAAGALVNIIDKPDVCDVLFGSIVNRSPVVVGISTDGAAPVMGQAIRRRVETLLPPAIAAWGALAVRIRDAVTARLAPGAARRIFWERFAERAFGPAPDNGEAERLIAEADGAGRAAEAAGRVILVGAGPGEPELLTLKAVRALQSADVVLYDDLVSADVLELARREARRVVVGKRGGRASCRQEDINDLMVGLARAGERVVRLKAGDPMVFGRAGEEIDRLTAEGIPVEVVPGISAGIALAAALGASLTHRDAAHSLRFVTGHAKSGELDDGLDWRGLADPDTTLVVYMGGRTAGRLAARLIAEGLPGETPVVFGFGVGQPGQRIERHRLADLVVFGSVPTAEPLVIGIGRVFAAGGR
jgi:uroporphyrin-III C-methyltransferase/precorrin-2 dehydrogenase/sirohydrochlorin ferrochelatase